MIVLLLRRSADHDYPYLRHSWLHNQWLLCTHREYEVLPYPEPEVVMAGIFSTIGSVLNVVTSVAEGLEEQANGWREVGSYAVKKAEAESAKAFLEELGAVVPNNVEDQIALASLLRELMTLSAVRSRDSNQAKRLVAVKTELVALRLALDEQAKATAVSPTV